MKTVLICPAVRPAVPGLAEDCPLVLRPCLGQCLVGHWIEHVAALGAREVRVIAVDQADQIRAAVGDGERWGVKLEVVAAHLEPTVAEATARFRPMGEPGWLDAPHAVVVMSHLPGMADFALFDSYASWFAALLAWMPRALTPARVRMREIRPGIWAGARARIAARAQLLAPCWIGDQVFVEPDAIVGPHAIVEDRAVVAARAQVTLSWIGPDTFVGPLTSVSSSLAWAETIINWRTDSSLRVPDPFLLSSLARPKALGPPGAAHLAAAARITWLESWRDRPQPVAEAELPG